MSERGRARRGSLIERPTRNRAPRLVEIFFSVTPEAAPVRLPSSVRFPQRLFPSHARALGVTPCARARLDRDETPPIPPTPAAAAAAAMPSLSSHLGGTGAPAPTRAGSGRPEHANDDDDTRASHADTANPTSASAPDAAALSSLHDAKHRVAFARSVSRDASALSSRPTRVDPDTLPRRKYSGERDERPPMQTPSPPRMQQTHMMTKTYDDDGDDDDGDEPSSGDRPARPAGALSDDPPVDWRKKKIEVIKMIHADGTVTYPRDVEVEFGGETVKPDMKKYEHLAPGDPLPPGLRVPGWTHMPEDVLAPPPAPTADDLKFGNPKFKPPEANDPEFIKRRAEAIERDKIKNVPPRPDHPFADPEKRLYRQPDGTLGRKRPPRKPYTVAARREFADLCYYARTNGGCAKCTEGVCHRHGTGVLWAHHR